MQTPNPNLIVISGGPGAGKTTLLHTLHRCGYACVPEVARQIIQEQHSTGGDALPWSDTTAYTELMLDRSISSFLEHENARRLTFFDRGLPDTLAYARIIHLPDRLPIEQACSQHRYAESAFLAPPWPAIYENDTERTQTFSEAIAVFEEIVNVYTSCGYRPIFLPQCGPEERADFVLQCLKCANVAT
jgi:predicted ATPase